jgi:dTDP-glucose 4,6-dehydratase/UDP-glucose 4-epimerase
VGPAIKTLLVTGGSGFIGSALVKRLVHLGHRVRVLDNGARGDVRRLAEVMGKLEYIQADIRDSQVVEQACKRVDGVFHLASVNGTRFFYSKPELVLEVGIKGIFNVIDACMHQGVAELFLASSSEVYQEPRQVPTDETAALTIPDPRNPRYSYAGAKIASELIALHAGGRFQRTVIFRPHNVYGPDMGFEHVIPEFIVRLKALGPKKGFPIQGTGQETRSFVFIDDCVDGIVLLLEKGLHQNIYHVGTEDEVTVSSLAQRIARCLDREIEIEPGALAAGSTPRRCPDTSKLKRLGYSPKVTLDVGLSRTVPWYLAHSQDEGDRT